MAKKFMQIPGGMRFLLTTGFAFPFKDGTLVLISPFVSFAFGALYPSPVMGFPPVIYFMYRLKLLLIRP